MKTQTGKGNIVGKGSRDRYSVDTLLSFTDTCLQAWLKPEHNSILEAGMT